MTLHKKRILLAVSVFMGSTVGLIAKPVKKSAKTVSAEIAHNYDNEAEILALKLQRLELEKEQCALGNRQYDISNEEYTIKNAIDPLFDSNQEQRKVFDQETLNIKQYIIAQDKAKQKENLILAAVGAAMTAIGSTAIIYDIMSETGKTVVENSSNFLEHLINLRPVDFLGAAGILGAIYTFLGLVESARFSRNIEHEKKVIKLIKAQTKADEFRQAKLKRQLVALHAERDMLNARALEIGFMIAEIDARIEKLTPKKKATRVSTKFQNSVEFAVEKTS